MAVRRNIIVIGASAGGVEAISRILADLSRDLPAAVFVVIHTAPHGPSVLPQIFSRAGPLPAAHARDGEVIRHGRVYVAPPDFHMTLDRGKVRLLRSKMENHARPAIDPLFRSAALHYGSEVAGLILTGYLDDGAAGLFAVKARGGVAMVQDPRDAREPSMPRSALEQVEPDYLLPLYRIGATLVDLAHDRSSRRRRRPARRSRSRTGLPRRRRRCPSRTRSISSLRAQLRGSGAERLKNSAAGSARRAAKRSRSRPDRAPEPEAANSWPAAAIPARMLRYRCGGPVPDCR